VLFIGLGALALVGLAAAPETGTPNSHAKATLAVAAIPGTAAAATIAAFSATGLFAGLSGSFLATTFDRPSHALAGATLFLVFSSGVLSQLATGKLRAPRVLALGVTSMLAGVALIVTAVRLSTPSLVLFLVGGALIGAGAGLVFKGTTGIVLDAAAPEERVAMTSTLIITALFGLSIPVVGAGVALAQASPQPTPCSASALPSRSAWRCQGGRCSVGARVALEAWNRCVTTLRSRTTRVREENVTRSPMSGTVRSFAARFARPS
jgi:hypothetical protein